MRANYAMCECGCEFEHVIQYYIVLLLGRCVVKLILQQIGYGMAEFCTYNRIIAIFMCVYNDSVQINVIIAYRANYSFESAWCKCVMCMHNTR